MSDNIRSSQSSSRPAGPRAATAEPAVATAVQTNDFSALSDDDLSAEIRRLSSTMNLAGDIGRTCGEDPREQAEGDYSALLVIEQLRSVVFGGVEHPLRSPEPVEFNARAGTKSKS